MWLTERLKDFIEIYPEIEVSLIVREDELDLSMRQADVAIRLAPPQQPDLIQRHLITMRHGAFASAGYLERHGMPHTLDDLDRHRLIAYDETYYPPFTNINWLLHAGLEPGKRRRPAIRVNNIYGMYRAARRRHGHRRPARLHGQPDQRPDAGAAGAQRPGAQRLPRLSRGAAPLAPGCGVPRLPVAADRRGPPLTHHCRRPFQEAMRFAAWGFC